MVTVQQPSLKLPCALLAAAVLLSGCEDREPAEGGRAVVSSPEGPDVPRRTVVAPSVDPAPPLADLVVVLDPGHQLGNAAFPAEIDALVDAGGFLKPCNTTGTATSGGYPEATFAWEVARLAGRQLRRLGARVLLTRQSNSAGEWGPCIDERGRAGNPGSPGPTADLKVSIHADGSLAPGAHGFHVIAPPAVAPWTSDIAEPSLALAEVVRDSLVEEGFAPATYAGTQGIDIRGDLGTLNLSDVPAVLVELGNMRHPDDARRMTSAEGRRHYASALVLSIERFSAR